MLPAAPPPVPTPSQIDRPCVLHRGVVVAAVCAPAVADAASTANAMPASTMPESTHRAGFDVVISSIICALPSGVAGPHEISRAPSDATSAEYPPYVVCVTV